MNRRFLLALGMAAFCGLLAILVAQQYLQNEINKKRQLSDSSVVAASVDIPAGTRITADQLKLISYRSTDLPTDAFFNLNDVVGRVALEDLPARTPILIRKVAKPGQGANLISDKLPEGMRAVSVRVDEASSVAGFATPGNAVDIIAVLNPGGARPVSKVILQNIRILAIGKQTQVRPDDKTGAAGNTVTLAVTPAQGETLKLAEREGTLQLMLRNASDTNMASTPGAGTSDVIDNGLARRATPTPVRAGQSALWPQSAAIPPIPATWPATAANEPPNARQTKKSPAAEATPTPSPKAHAIEIIEGAKKQTVQVMN
jgi:pilus assembly protein CpaB